MTLSVKELAVAGLNDDVDWQFASASPADPTANTETTVDPPFLAGFDLVHGTWLDACLCLKGDQCARFSRNIFDRLNWVFQPHGRLPQRVDYRANFVALLECVIANGLRAEYFRETNWVAYSRKDDFYVGRAGWLSGGALARLIDLMAEAGIVEAIGGEMGRASSTYRLTEEWLDFATNMGVTHSGIDHRPPPIDSLIILRGPKQKKKGRRRSPPAPELRYERTPQTEKWAAEIDRYNHFIEEHDIALPLSAEGERSYIAQLNAKQPRWNVEPGLKRPELFDRHVVRIFNDGTFDHGGRLYRAWWMNAPSNLRRGILIDGEQTAELDYSGFVVRSLYHQQGVEYVGDPYELEELCDYAEERGRKRDYFRPFIKKLVVALLNGEEGTHPERVRLKTSFLPRFERTEVEALLADKHPLIAQYFRTKEGKRNQRLDSDIAIAVLFGLMEQGELALSIHDSFIVRQSMTEELKELMLTAYRDRLGFDPIVSAK